MDNIIIIASLVQAVKDGRMTLQDVPEIYRQQVEDELNEVEGA